MTDAKSTTRTRAPDALDMRKGVEERDPTYAEATARARARSNDGARFSRFPSLPRWHRRRVRGRLPRGLPRLSDLRLQRLVRRRMHGRDLVLVRRAGARAVVRHRVRARRGRRLGRLCRARQATAEELRVRPARSRDRAVRGVRRALSRMRHGVQGRFRARVRRGGVAARRRLETRSKRVCNRHLAARARATRD